LIQFTTYHRRSRFNSNHAVTIHHIHQTSIIIICLQCSIVTSIHPDEGAEMLASMTRRRSGDDLVVALVKHAYAPSRMTSNIRTWDCGRPGTELTTVISGVISWKRRRSCRGMLHDDEMNTTWQKCQVDKSSQRQTFINAKNDSKIT